MMPQIKNMVLRWGDFFYFRGYVISIVCFSPSFFSSLFSFLVPTPVENPKHIKSIPNLFASKPYYLGSHMKKKKIFF